MIDSLSCISSLETKLRKSVNKGESLRILTSIADVCFNHRKYMSCKKFAEKGYLLADRLGEQSHSAYFKYLLGMSHHYLDEIEQSLDCFKTSLETYHILGDTAKISLLNRAIGDIYDAIGEYFHSLEFYLEAAKYEADNMDILRRCGRLYEYCGRTNEALDLLNRCLRIASENRDDNLEILTLIDLAEISMNSDDLTAGREYFSVALKKAENSCLVYEAVISVLGLSECFYRVGQKKESLEYISKYESLLEKIEDSTKQLECYKKLANLYSKLSEFQRAFTYLRKYSEVDDKIYSDRLSYRLCDIQTNFELEKREYESINIIDVASRLASIGVIVGGITHEINQPLSAINVSADSVLYWDKQNREYLPEIIVRAAREISESAKKIDEIILHMRHFWTESEPEPVSRVDINIAVERAIDLIRSQINSYNIELVLNLSKDELVVECDQIYLEQIVINLIINALHLSEQISKTAKKIDITSVKKANDIQIKVEDNFCDCRIDEALQTPYGTTINWQESCQLGLLIVKQTVDRFNGKVVQQLNRNGGMTYVVSFPSTAT